MEGGWTSQEAEGPPRDEEHGDAESEQEWNSRKGERRWKGKAGWGVVKATTELSLGWRSRDGGRAKDDLEVSRAAMEAVLTETRKSWSWAPCWGRRGLGWQRDVVSRRFWTQHARV